MWYLWCQQRCHHFAERHLPGNQKQWSSLWEWGPPHHPFDAQIGKVVVGFPPEIKNSGGIRILQSQSFKFYLKFPERLTLFLAPRWRLWRADRNFPFWVIISSLSSLFFVSFVFWDPSVCSKDISSTFSSLSHVLSNSQRKGRTFDFHPVKIHVNSMFALLLRSESDLQNALM